MSDSQNSSQHWEADRLIYAGLLGVSAGTVIQLLDQAELDIALQVACFCFAIAIPFLAVGLIADHARRAGRTIPGDVEVVALLGAFLAIVGFIALFFHLGAWLGIAFSVCAFFCLGLVRFRL